MSASLRRRARDALFLFPAALARFGVVDRRKGEEAFDLAVPVMVTGGLRTVLRTADFLMVSVAVGESAVAGLELGFQYYFISFGLALALTSGTISVVSRFKGAGEDRKADLAVKQSLWIGLAVSLPAVVVSWLYAEQLIAALTDDPDTVAKGAAYLRIVMLAVAARFWNLIAARALAGSGDTRTPMYVRLVTLPTNIGLNALLIFGLFGLPALGVAGAAWGTAIANTLAAGVFLVVLVSGRRAVRLPLGRPHVDVDILREIVRVSTPLAGTQMARRLGRFPFLFVLGVLGTPVLAAYAIGRQVMLLAMMPAWGYATAASTLVGQHVGAGEDDEADDYGWQTLRLALATQLLIAAALFAFARPLARVFGTEHVGLTVDFVRVFGLGVAAFSVSRTMRGGLRGAGDTRWPFYGSLAGSFLVKLPVAAAALPAGVVAVTVGGLTVDPGLGLGVAAVYASILGELYVQAGVNTFRFWTGEWKRVARESDVGAGARAE